MKRLIVGLIVLVGVLVGVDFGAAALAESARAAFDLGVQRTSGLAIGIALLAALVSWRTLKHAPAVEGVQH